MNYGYCVSGRNEKWGDYATVLPLTEPMASNETEYEQHSQSPGWSVMQLQRRYSPSIYAIWWDEETNIAQFLGETNVQM